MSTTTRPILVIGAGELGLPVIEHLTRRATSTTNSTCPITVTVLIRPSTLETTDVTKLTHLNHLRSLPNITLIPGDVSSSSLASLTTTFTPYHTIISCTGYALGASGVQLKIAKAAIAAKVELFLPWQFGADYGVIGRGAAQDLFDEQLDVRDVLGAQEGTKWVVVSVGVFMSFLFERFWGVVQLGGEGEDGSGSGNEDEIVCRGLGGWETRITATAPEDIGRCVAAVVVDGVDVEAGEGEVTGACGSGVVVRLAGGTKSYGEIAEIVERVVGGSGGGREMKMKREVWTVEQLERESREDPGNGVKKYRVVFAKERGVAWDVAGTFNQRKGIEMVGIEEWVKRTMGGKK